VEYFYNLASNNLNNSIFRLVSIIQVLRANILVVKEEVIEDIE
jgi:hypothetical protein